MGPLREIILFSRSFRMSSAATWTTVVLVVIVAASALVLAPSGTAAAHAPGTPTIIRPLTLNDGVVPSLKILEQTFPTDPVVDSLTSLNSTTLVLNDNVNYAVTTYLYKVPGNTSKLVQSVNPGGAATYPVSEVGAGGVFYVSYENGTTGHTFWEKITLAGKVTRLVPPFGDTFDWDLLYGNQSTMYVVDETDPSLVFALNPTTLAVTQNLSHWAPSNVLVDAVAPAPGRLYMAGAIVTAANRSDVWFGYRTNSTGLVTNVSSTPKMAEHLYGTFYSIVVQGSYVYLGGELEHVTKHVWSSAAGYFYRFDPGTGAYKNETSLLPVAKGSVWAIEPWGTTVGISQQWWQVSFSTGAESFEGGIYHLAANGKSFVNVSGSLPPGYVSAGYFETADAGGWFINGGSNANTGAAQLVAIKT